MFPPNQKPKAISIQTMKSRIPTLILLAVGVSGSHAATLLQNSGYTVATTEVHYDFNNEAKNVWTALTTDASGKGRVLTGGGSPGDGWGGTGDMIVRDGAAGWSMSNTSLMPGDNYQTTIFVAPEPNWPYAHGKMVIFNYDGVELSYNADTYTATVGGNTVGTYTAGSSGIMIQKMNGEFSLWSAGYNSDGTAGTWTQRGTEVTSATSGDDFSTTHIFIKPGSGENYWGYAGDFKITSLAIPEPGSAFLGSVGVLAFLRRKR
jgi:hypothetical protein